MLNRSALQLVAYFAVALLFFVFESSALAQRTWNGGGLTNNWSDAANWNGTAPVANNTLTFTGVTQTTTNNDFASSTQFNGITFDNLTSGGAFTLNGNSVTLGGNIVTIGTTNSPTHTININLVLNTARTLNTVGSNNVSVNGVVSGTGGLTKAGGGIVTLSGVNTYAGQTLINQGSLSINTLANQGTSSSIGTGNTLGVVRIGNAAANGTLIYTGAAASTDRQIQIGNGTAGTADGSATITSSGTGAVSFTNVNFNALDATATAARTLTLAGTNTGSNSISGVIADNSLTGNVGVTKTGTGAWALNGLNTYSGQTLVNQGSLTINTLANQGIASSLGTGATAGVVRIGNAGTNGTLIYSGAAASTNRQIQIGNGAAGTADGNATINSSGTGAISFTNTNFNASDSAATVARTLTLTGSNTGANTIAGVISDNSTLGSIGVIKTGAGTWVLSGLNSFSGSVQVNQGTIQANTIANQGIASSLGTGASGGIVRLGNGGNTGALTYTGAASSTDRQIQIGNGAGAGADGGATINSNGTGAITFTNAAFNVADAGAITARSLILSGSNLGSSEIQGVISDNSAAGAVIVNKQNSGTWLLSGANTYSGQVRINNGTLQVNSIANTGVASSLGTGSTTSDIRFGNGANTGALAYVGNAQSSTNRQVTIGFGGSGGATIVNNGSGSITFSNANFNLSDAAAVDARTLTLGGINTGANTISGIIADNSAVGAISVQKIGTGTWILSGANQYTGTTSVNQGSLVVQGSLAGGSVSVLAGASLAGLGTIGGATTIAGVHSPGNSPGTQSFGNDLTYQSTSQLIWELAGNTDATLDRGLVYDAINGQATRTLTIQPGASSILSFNGLGSLVNWNDSFWSTSHSWLVYDGFGAANGVFSIGSISTDSLGASFGSGQTAGGQFQWTSNGGQLFLTYGIVAVPEPSSLLLIGLGCILLSASRRVTVVR